MSLRALVCHPAELPPPGVRDLLALAEWREGRLVLTWRLCGDQGGLRLPPLGPALRRDGLWEHTCFEAFLAREGEAGYLELNASPSGSWALYAFDGPRSGMRALPGPVPDIRLRLGAEELTLQARLDPVLFLGTGALQVGLCAVLEEASGRRSHWALAHPEGGPPDFHHRAGFLARLTVPEAVP